MAQPVWVLSVDLQTKTATFQSGLADAAKTARGAFRDISSASGEMAESLGKHSVDVRHTLGLVDNVLRGDHMRAFVDVIRIYQDSALVMGALPFAAVAGGFALIAGVMVGALVKMHEWREEQEQINRSLVDMDTAGQEAFNHIRDKILEAEKHAAELHHNYLTALAIELQLIDHQSLDDLVKQFDALDKEAQKVFDRVKGSWYTLWIGTTGAAHAMEVFKSNYDALIAQGKDGEARDLLKGTLNSARETLAALQTIRAESSGSAGLLGRDVDYTKQAEARKRLNDAGLAGTKDELSAQQAAVETLQRQLDISNALSTLKEKDKANASTEAGQQMGAEHSAAAREAAASQLRMAESALAGEKAAADAQLAIHKASLEDRLKSDLDFAAREHAAKEAGNQADIAALDKGGKDYQNQLKALHDKALEEDAAYQAQVQELNSRASEQIAERDLTNLETAIREQIDATQEGSAARLAAVNAAIREEEARNLQNTSMYRDLLQQRVEITRQMSEQQSKLAADAGKEQAEYEERTGEQQVSALKAFFEIYNSTHRTSDAQRATEAKIIADEEYQIKARALAQQITALDTSGKDYQNKLKALQDQEKELTQQHENELTQIKEKADAERNQRILSADQRFNDEIAQGLTNVLMRHQTFAQMMTSLSDQVVSGLMRNAIQSVLADDFTKERDAAAAARKAFLAGMQLPFPANLVAAPVLAAGAFTAVMAFQSGTDMVPGIGKGDRVPALLEPGEGVVPGGVMDGLRDVARSGGFQQRPSVQVHVRYTAHAQAFDEDGINRALASHGAQLEHHVARAIRKANR